MCRQKISRSVGAIVFFSHTLIYFPPGEVFRGWWFGTSRAFRFWYSRQRTPIAASHLASRLATATPAHANTPPAATAALSPPPLALCERSAICARYLLDCRKVLSALLCRDLWRSRRSIIRGDAQISADAYFDAMDNIAWGWTSSELPRRSFYHSRLIEMAAAEESWLLAQNMRLLFRWRYYFLMEVRQYVPEAMAMSSSHSNELWYSLHFVRVKLTTEWQSFKAYIYAY